VQAGAFDVVIIDEASQTGPDGLILQCLGNQCIVVGDDKQISSEAPGVDLNNVRALLKLHLGGFPFAETMLPTSMRNVSDHDRFQPFGQVPATPCQVSYSASGCQAPPVVAVTANSRSGTSARLCRCA
jgi:hypothetical protein